MTYQGRVKGGVVVLDPGVILPEGASVRIEPLEMDRELGRPHFRPAGTWDGPPGELDRLLAQVQELRDTDPTEADDARFSP